jgi:hypothetical protein
MLQLRLAALDGLPMQLLQKGNTPATACPRAAAFRELAGHARAVQSYEIDELAPAYVKAVAHLGVQIHNSAILASGVDNLHDNFTGQMPIAKPCHPGYDNGDLNTNKSVEAGTVDT